MANNQYINKVSYDGTTLIDLTADTVDAAHLAQGYTAHDASGAPITGTMSGGGGGTGGITQDQDGYIVLPDQASAHEATNIVQGTFTTSATTGAASSFAIPYTGNGYPIMLAIFIAGGAWNATPGGNSDWINLVQRYVIGQFVIVKAEMNTTPSYNASASQTNNLGVVNYTYKGNATDPSSLTSSGSRSAIAYNQSDATATASQTVRFKDNGTTVSYYVASTSYGLMPNTEYSYIAVYSS